MCPIDATLKLHTYTGEVVKPLGFCAVTVEYNGQSKEHPMYVTKGERPTLLAENG